MSVNISITELRQAADQCVKCAVCLPHCPTYALSPEETQSPRGRITLLQGIVYENLEPTAEVHKHLNNCLSCGRCEQVCPARVPYTRLLDGTRFLRQKPAHAADTERPTRTKRLLAAALRSPRALRWLTRLIKLARFQPIFSLLAALSPRLQRGLKLSAFRATHALPVSSLDQPDAWLFTGCLTDAFEGDITTNACRLAQAFGISLQPTPEGLCCGALYQHMGDVENATQLTNNTIDALSAKTLPIVSLLSGCERGLKDGLSFSTDPRAPALGDNMTDLFDLLKRSPQQASFLASNDTVALYSPCSSSSKNASTLTELINQVSQPGLVLLSKAHGCCGAAGDHMVTQPERADQLAKPIIQEIRAQRISHVLTPNLGCAWHLRSNLSDAGLGDIVVEHPAQWLARHIKARDGDTDARLHG